MAGSRIGTVSIVLSSAGIAAIPIGMALYGAGRIGDVDTCGAGILVMYLGAPALALLGIITGIIAALRGQGGWKLGVVAVLLVVLGYATFYPSLIHACGPRSTNDVSAVGSLRTLNTVIATYTSAHRKLPPSLEALGPDPKAVANPQQQMPPTAEHADLIDGVLAKGQKSGYIFTYTPGKADGDLLPYAITARPMTFGKTGTRSFFTDETGVIRQTKEGRAATKDDPPIS